MNAYLERAFGLSRRRALVTGAGRGIGRGIAEALAGACAEVCVHYHTSESPAREVVERIKAAGGQAWAASADLTNSDQANALAAELGRHWPALDILVNNAGDLVQRAQPEELTDEVIERVVRVNLHTAVYTIRAALPLLRRGAKPAIVNLSSVAAHNGGGPGAALYAAMKSAVHTYTRGLARELAPGIRVNGIAPGVVLTDFHDRHTSPEALEGFQGRTALGRLGKPEEMGGAAVFLCSDAASYITGEVIEANGGLWFA